jgi:nucleoside-diphosphate-sugar epimerase
MSTEVMKQALEALEHVHRTGDTQVFDLCYADKVIPALRAAIEQAEKQEPGKPLTDEQILEHFQENIDTGSLLSFVDGVRFAEAAHGITGEKK